MQIKKIHSTYVAILLAGLSVSASSLPAAAQFGQPGARHEVVEPQRDVFRRTFSVSVTNTTTGETGCHNETTQTSEPGRCEQPPH
jgi:hypothetical protein